MEPTSPNERSGWVWRAATRGIAAVLILSIATTILLLAATPGVRDVQSRVAAEALKREEAWPELQLPARFVDALIATEDKRFFSPFDFGVDPVAIFRVALGRLGLLTPNQGGSTIDQQLAKMVFTPGRSGALFVDLEQIGIAIKLHFSYSHPAILRMYAEMAYFGHGYYGLTAASEGYFGRAPDELTWLQAALLAGVVNAPSADDPVKHLARALERCHHVLGRLVAEGYLSQQQAATALRESLGLRSDHANTAKNRP